MPSDSPKSSPAPSIASILSLIAAMLSFNYGAAMGLILAVLAIVFGAIGLILSLLPGIRGGILSIISMILGVIGILAALFKLVGNVLG